MAIPVRLVIAAHRGSTGGSAFTALLSITMPVDLLAFRIDPVMIIAPWIRFLLLVANDKLPLPGFNMTCQWNCQNACACDIYRINRTPL